MFGFLTLTILSDLSDTMTRTDSRLDVLEKGLASLGEEVTGISTTVNERIDGMTTQFNGRMDRIEALLNQLLTNKGKDSAEASEAVSRRLAPPRAAHIERPPPAPTQAKLECPISLGIILLLGYPVPNNTSE